MPTPAEPTHLKVDQRSTLKCVTNAGANTFHISRSGWLREVGHALAGRVETPERCVSAIRARRRHEARGSQGKGAGSQVTQKM